MASRNRPFHQTAPGVLVASGNGATGAAVEIQSGTLSSAKSNVWRIRNRDATNSVNIKMGDATVAAVNTGPSLSPGQTELFDRCGATHLAAWGIGGVVSVEVVPGEGI